MLLKRDFIPSGSGMMPMASIMSLSPSSELKTKLACEATKSEKIIKACNEISYTLESNRY